MNTSCTTGIFTLKLMFRPNNYVLKVFWFIDVTIVLVFASHTNFEVKI